jgi:hypothetical protein
MGTCLNLRFFLEHDRISDLGLVQYDNILFYIIFRFFQIYMTGFKFCKTILLTSHGVGGATGCDTVCAAGRDMSAWALTEFQMSPILVLGSCLTMQLVTNCL